MRRYGTHFVTAVNNGSYSVFEATIPAYKSTPILIHTGFLLPYFFCRHVLIAASIQVWSCTTSTPTHHSSAAASKSTAAISRRDQTRFAPWTLSLPLTRRPQKSRVGKQFVVFQNRTSCPVARPYGVPTGAEGTYTPGFFWSLCHCHFFK